MGFRAWCAALALVPEPLLALNQPAANVTPTPAEKPSRAARAPLDDGFFGRMSLSSRKDPIVIKANQLEFDYQNDRIVYRGKVHVTQADLIIDSAILTVTYTRADDQKDVQLKEVVAQGEVVITQAGRWATGGQAVFDQSARTIVLSENPTLHDGPNQVAGERIIVFLDEGRSVVESSPQKRVSAVLYPGSTDQAPVATGSTRGNPP